VGSLLVVAAIYLFSRVALGPTRGEGMMAYSFFPFSFGLFGGFFILFIFVLPIMILWPRGGGTHLGGSQQDDAIRILRERYTPRARLRKNSSTR
jgi:hypothetical protein